MLRFTPGRSLGETDAAKPVPLPRNLEWLRYTVVGAGGAVAGHVPGPVHGHGRHGGVTVHPNSPRLVNPDLGRPGHGRRPVSWASTSGSQTTTISKHLAATNHSKETNKSSSPSPPRDPSRKGDRQPNTADYGLSGKYPLPSSLETKPPLISIHPTG